MSGDGEGLYGVLPVGFENLGPEGKQSIKKVVVKLHLKKDETYKTFAITNTTTTSELLATYAKKIGLKAAESLQLLQVDAQGVERVVDARDRPGGLQLKWQAEPAAAGKFVVTFSEASKESIRQSVKARRSSTADALEITLGLHKPAAAAAASSVDDDLAALDAIAADFAVPLSQRTSSVKTPAAPAAAAAAAAAAAPAKKTATPQQQQQQQPPALNTKMTPGGKTRLKIVPVGEDAEFQGLLSALKSGRVAPASAATDDFDRIVGSLDGELASGGSGGATSASSDMVALEEFGIRDDDFNVVVADSTASTKSATVRKKAEDTAFAEIDGALSFALSSLDDMVADASDAPAASAGGDIDFDALLASLSTLSD
jgi:hypothetical protein